MRMLRPGVEALLGLPLRERSVRYIIHGDLALSGCAETPTPVATGEGRWAVANCLQPQLAALPVHFEGTELIVSSSHLQSLQRLRGVEYTVTLPLKDED